MKIGIDIDGTITNETKGWDYENRTPDLKVISKINKLYCQGHFIELFSSRLKKDRQVTIAWLKKYGVKYNNLILGKPRYDYYVGDEVKTIHQFLKEK